MKKTLAIMLALIMVLAMVPALAETEPTETINIPVTKKWDDKGNEGDKPAEVTVKLLANNQDTNNTIILNATNNWSGAFNGMPVSDDNGIIAYTVMEEPIPNYEAVYTQPQPEQVTVGEWGEKITPASTPTYTVTGNIIVANKGGNYYVWTKDNLSDAQKPKLLAAINAANLEGLGKPLAMNNTEFQSGIPATFNNGNVTIDNAGDDTKITFKETNVWSLFYEGTLTIKEATGAIITNTYKSSPESDFDVGTIIVKKTVSGNASSTLDEFKFKVTVLIPTDPNPDPSGSPIARSANAAKAPAARGVDKTATKDDFVLENGIWTLPFTLKHGDSMKIEELPAGYIYRIEETDALGYTVTVNGVATTSKDVELKEGETVTLIFNNYKDNGGGGGHSHYHPDPTPVPVMVIPPKTGDMTLLQYIARLLGLVR